MENSWVQKENPPRYDLYSNEPMLFLNGIAHVIVLERSESDYNWTVKLLGVDLNSEEFLTITLPGSLATYHHHKHELHLIETNSRLGVVDSEPTAAGHRIGIWLMTETDGVAYWSNIFSLTVPKMQVFRAVGIRDNGDLLAYGRNAKVKGLLSYGNQGTKDLLLGLGCRRFCNSLRFVDDGIYKLTLRLGLF
ncbi:hypothetical protein CCACVL1_12996 [Corchorus capsularis]|uniref:Uncharacterized protein n=1 Tax=Corchorus capsularis TaxID=210143 RepID=A0A1R3ICU8_COCAP|nr:hypothetical protein CCACVL1_12996 [Corchorus capsularis]